MKNKTILITCDTSSFRDTIIKWFLLTDEFSEIRDIDGGTKKFDENKMKIFL